MRLKKVREGEIKGKSDRKGVVEITAGCDRRTAEAHGEEAGSGRNQAEPHRNGKICSRRHNACGGDL
jgi:hypothetical protein